MRPRLCPMSVCSSPREREKKRVVRPRFPEKRLLIELIYIFIHTRCPLGTRLISNGSENSSFIGNTPNKTNTFSIPVLWEKNFTITSFSFSLKESKSNQAQKLLRPGPLLPGYFRTHQTGARERQPYRKRRAGPLQR